MRGATAQTIVRSVMSTFIAGRRTKYVVLAVALGIAAVLGALSVGLADVQTQDPADSLPRGSQSREVLQLSQQYRSGRVQPAVVVFHRAAGLTTDDRRRLGDARERVDAARLPAARPSSPVQTSRDRTTAFFATPLIDDPDAPTDRIPDTTDRLRELVGGSRGELQVAVTGPAGLATDITHVFDGADGLLLGASSLLVLILLILIYRSPIFWFVPLLTVVLAEASTRGAGYLLGSAGAVVTPASSGITSVLVFGAATDYALLLVARYREELRRQADHHEAMRLAWQASAPAITASALTVVCALSTLLLADVGDNRALGPLCAAGVLLSLFFSLTVLPALLLITGRRIFWPRVPHDGDAADGHVRWTALGRRIARRPRRVWVGSTLVLGVLALGLTQAQLSTSASASFTSKVESLTGQELLAKGFPAGSAAPVDVIVADRGRTSVVRKVLTRQRTVDRVTGPERGAPGDKLTVTLAVDPFSDAGQDAIPGLRRALAGTGALVGGQSAQDYDLRVSSERDNRVVVPVALLVVGLILVGLLRALALPGLLLLTVVGSFAAAFGTGVTVFDHVLGYAGESPGLPLVAFVFLVALGVDYNIFLVARAREETLRHGTAAGILRALEVTGGVITSAGIVLAGTFLVLAALPLVTLRELGFIVAFGVLLDTLLVRSVLVPALILDVGRRVWWPSRLE